MHTLCLKILIILENTLIACLSTPYISSTIPPKANNYLMQQASKSYTTWTSFAPFHLIMLCSILFLSSTVTIKKFFLNLWSCTGNPLSFAIFSSFLILRNNLISYWKSTLNNSIVLSSPSTCLFPFSIITTRAFSHLSNVI